VRKVEEKRDEVWDPLEDEDYFPEDIF